MLLSAAKLDFAAAFAYNQALFILLPIMGALAVIKLIFAPRLAGGKQPCAGSFGAYSFDSADDFRRAEEYPRHRAVML